MHPRGLRHHCRSRWHTAAARAVDVARAHLAFRHQAHVPEQYLGDAFSVLVSRRHCTIVASFCSGTLGATLIYHSVDGTFVGDTRLVRQPTKALTGIRKLQIEHKFTLRTSAEITTRAFHITFRFVLDGPN